MRKLFTNCKRVYTALLTLVALFAFGTANAAPVDLGAIEFGKDYDVPNYSKVSGTLVVPESAKPNSDGKIVLTQDGVPNLQLYKDGAQITRLPSKSPAGDYGKNGQVVSYEVEAGASYEIQCNFVMAGGKVCWYVDGVAALPLQIKSMNMDAGSTIDFTRTKNLTITFNQDIKTVPTSGHKFIYVNRLDNKETEISLPYRSGVWGVYSNCYNRMLKGEMLPGDEFSIKIVGIESANGQKCDIADAEGNLNFTFRCGSEPLVKDGKETVPSQFLSYYAPGNPDGVISMTFKNNPALNGIIDNKLSLSPQTRATIGYGNLEGEEGEYYYEEIVPTLSEDSLTIYVDLSGKVRTPQTMTPLYADAGYKEISVGLIHVVDKFGNPVKADTDVNIGSFGWVFPYFEIERVNITADFTPANGTSLSNAENVEVTLSPVDQFSFSGFNIAYTDADSTKTVVVGKEACKIDTSTPGEATYVFAVPAEVKGKKDIVITLADLLCNDGFDHSEDVKAQYDSFVITFSDPASGSRLAQLSNGQEIRIETNYSEQYPEMYIMYEIVDMNPVDPDEAIIKTQSWLTRQEDGSYTSSCHRDYKLYTGHTYHVLFEAWATEMDKNYHQPSIGTAYIALEGTTAPYVPSDVVLKSITPDPEQVLEGEEAPVFTVEFDGMVNLNATSTFIVDGFGASTAFASITPEDPEENEGLAYSPVWKLAVPQSYWDTLNSQITISFAATDTKGRRVQGTEGKDENSYFIYMYDTYKQYATYDIAPVGEAPLASVKEFTVSSERGINYSWYLPYNAAYVVDNSRAVVAYVADVVAPELAEGQENYTSLTLVLDNEITEAGNYMLFIPKEYFVIGSEMSQNSSAENTLEFTITGGGESTLNIAYTPETGNVNSLPQRIDMMFVGITEIGLGSGAPTLTINGGEPIKLNDVELSWDDMNACTIVLPQEYTEAGTYVVNFPAGYFNLGSNGEPAPAISAEWVIVEPVTLNITVDPAPGVVTAIPNTITIHFNDYSEVGGGSGKAQLLFNGAVAETLPDANYGIDWNAMDQAVSGTYTEAGEYVFSFPEGYFSLGSGGEASPAFTLTYTIKTSTGIDSIVADENGMYNVYTLTGVKVLSTTDARELKALAPGFYIVNNVKMYVK